MSTLWTIAESLLGLLAGGVAIAVIFAVAQRLRKRGNRRRVARGQAPTVAAAIRQLGVGWWRARWRHGSATIGPGEIHWGPRFFRPGPEVRLANVRVTGERERKWFESWWLAPDLGVYTLDNRGKQYELAITVEEADLNELAQRVNQRATW